MLGNLPDSFLSQLADIDPVVGMLSNKLRKSCGVSCIDAWKFVTSRARYELVISNFCLEYYDLQGVSAIIHAKAAVGDPEFMYMVSTPRYHYRIYEAMRFAARNDLPHIIEHCFISLPSSITIRQKSRLIWNDVDENGSTRVLTWFLENQQDLMRFSIPHMCGADTATVKWCIDNLLESSPAPVTWLMMKVEAIMHENIESIELLDWVVVPPCPFPGLRTCGFCPDCQIRRGTPTYVNYAYFNRL